MVIKAERELDRECSAFATLCVSPPARAEKTIVLTRFKGSVFTCHREPKVNFTGFLGLSPKKLAKVALARDGRPDLCENGPWTSGPASPGLWRGLRPVGSVRIVDGARTNMV